MLKYIVLLLALVYALTLMIIMASKKRVKAAHTSNKAVLIIKPEVAEKNLEWLIFSFNSFATKNLTTYSIYLYSPCNQNDCNKQRILKTLSQRFNFQLLSEPPQDRTYGLVFYGTNSTYSNYWQKVLNQTLPKAN